MLPPQIIDVRGSFLGLRLGALAPSAAANEAWWHHRRELATRLPSEELAQLHDDVEHQLRHRGAVIIRMGVEVPSDCVRLLQVLVGETFGEIVTIAPDQPGRPLFKVSAVEGQAHTGGYKGNAKKRQPIGLHTDGSGIAAPTAVLSMSCIRQAQHGGESRLADSREVHGLVSHSALAILESPLPRENPYQELPSEQLLRLPVFDPVNAYRFSYHPARVRNGIVLVRGSLTPAESEALTELDETLDGCATDILLEPGDILMLDNQRIAHDRRGFVDSPAASRLIERLWIGGANPAAAHRG